MRIPLRRDLDRLRMFISSKPGDSIAGENTPLLTNIFIQPKTNGADLCDRNRQYGN